MKYKYIDAEKLIIEIRRLNSLVSYENNDRHDEGLHDAYRAVINVVNYLQQEQPECSSSLVDIDAVREDFMAEVYHVLSSEPTNDRANAIIKAFDSLPTVSQEQPEVDLEKEILDWIGDEDSCKNGKWTWYECNKMIRHFYKRGLNARKEE
jgi:hypothetical protein